VRSDGERSREAILDAAAELATVEGLDGLSLGRLAEVTGISKSGVFGLFGSKEDLQLATIDKARQVFVGEVVESALDAPPGRDQLYALCAGYLDHVERRVFPGGCFFASVASEVGSRPGPVRDRVASEQKRWTGLLLENAREAVRSGELDPDASTPEQLVLELSTMLTGADVAYLLHDDPAILEGVRAAIRARLGL
jgi:AcrR family transcriptional regulator